MELAGPLSRDEIRELKDRVDELSSKGWPSTTTAALGSRGGGFV